MFFRPTLPLLRKPISIKALSSGTVHGNSTSSLERCFHSMKGGKYGAFGTATLEKSNLDLSQKQNTKSSPEMATGGGGGEFGKKINQGGGDGGDDGSDDDDYSDLSF